MAEVQTSYSRYMTNAQAGQIADDNNCVIDTKVCEEAHGIGPGLAVSQGNADKGVTLGGAAFVGISVMDIGVQNSGSADSYVEGNNMGVLVEGDIWVQVNSDVIAHEQATYDTSTGEIGASGGTSITGAVFMTSASSGDMAVLRLGRSTGNIA